MFQVRYGDECFVLTATYTDNYYYNPDIVDGQTLMLRFELKHLGEFGYSTDVLSGNFIASSSRAVNLVPPRPPVRAPANGKCVRPCLAFHAHGRPRDRQCLRR